MKVLSLLFAFVLFTNAFSQVKEAESIISTKPKLDTIGWKNGGLISMNLAQTSLTNWSAGGENSVSIQGLMSLFAINTGVNSFWDNNLTLGYGVLQQGKDKKFIKTDDKIEFTTKYGLRLKDKFFIAGALNFKTQFTVGWNYTKDTQKISNFLSPAYLTGAVGLDWKPADYISIFSAPFTGRITIVNDNELANKGAFGVRQAVYDSLGNILEPGKKSKNELGGFIRISFSKGNFDLEILKNITITSKLELFTNYLNRPQNIDVNWENLLLLKVNKIISINLTTQLIYDDDVKVPIDSNGDGKFDSSAPRTQFKEIFGLGISITF